MDTAEELLRAGNAHFEHSEFDQAEACWQKALALFQGAHNEQRAGVCLGNLGVIHHIRGEVDQALACYQESLATARRVGNRQGQADALGNVASLHREQGKPK